MKFNRKCPICQRKATRRFGKLYFCDDHYKDVRQSDCSKRRKATGIWSERYVGMFSPDCKIYKDYLVKIH